MKRNFRISIFIILVILLSSGIVYSQTDFWECTSGPLNASAYSIVVASNGNIWVGTLDYETSLGGVYLSTNNGDTWVKKGNDFTNLVNSIAISPINGCLFVSTQAKALCRSTDDGESWVQLINRLDGYDILITQSGEIYCGTGGQFFIGSNNIYYSSDNGETWIEKRNGLPHQVVVPLALGGDGTLYTGTGSGVYRLTNGGDTWLPPSNYNNVFASGLAVSEDGSIFAATRVAGVLKSTDGGVTWTQINTGLSDNATASLIIYNSITKDIFINSNSRIYRSTDLGASWELKNSGISNEPYIRSFAFNPNTGQMYVATDNGVYRSTNHTVSVEELEEMPTTYSLSRNYPNPFNPTTTIQYSIPKDEFVKLVVYDITGRVVKELVSGHKVAGKYSVEFNATGLASGIYFYKLNTSGTPLINKMLLMK
jgi:photosystem II stability/assembly factor-like uncharacterized protein